MKKIPLDFSENFLQYTENNFNFTKKNIFEFELFCLIMLKNELNDVCSYNLIKIILFNGIIDKNEIDDEIFILDNFYEKIYELNSDFVEDNRYLDFTDLDIALSIITYSCLKFNFSSWKNFIVKYYYKGNIKLMPCYFIIER